MTASIFFMGHVSTGPARGIARRLALTLSKFGAKMSKRGNAAGIRRRAAVIEGRLPVARWACQKKKPSAGPA
jgi:hypothetical protein